MSNILTQRATNNNNNNNNRQQAETRNPNKVRATDRSRDFEKIKEKGPVPRRAHGIQRAPMTTLASPSRVRWSSAVDSTPSSWRAQPAHRHRPRRQSAERHTRAGSSPLLLWPPEVQCQWATAYVSLLSILVLVLVLVLPIVSLAAAAPGACPRFCAPSTLAVGPSDLFGSVRKSFRVFAPPVTQMYDILTQPAFQGRFLSRLVRRP